MVWRMDCEKRGWCVLAAIVLTNLCCVGSPAAKPTGQPKVTAPPESLKVGSFYKKYLDCGGLAIVSSDKVSDAAFFKLAEITNKMLAGRPDIRKAMVKARTRLLIIGATEQVTQLPEYAGLKPKEFWDRRARGLADRRIVSCGEENLLCLPDDRYDDENIFIHEFSHCIHGTLGRIKADVPFETRLKKIYEKALAKGLWKHTYAGSTFGEYWAEVQSQPHQHPGGTEGLRPGPGKTG